METTSTLRHNAAARRYELPLEGDDVAVVDYLPRDGYLILTHVGVPPQYEGRGIGSRLVREVLEEIQRQGLRIVPQCPFVEVYIRRHPEWEGCLMKR